MLNTVTTTFCGLLEHPLAVEVYEYVTLTAAAVVLVNTSFTVPVPVEAAWLIPATAALVQEYEVPEVLLEGV